jgi:Imidazolonepropionase and related amidohydrolases
MKKHFLLGALAFCFGAFLQAQNTGKTYFFKNGQWYDGKGFVTANWYSNNGQLTKKAPAKVDSVIDLQGKWVVPAFGDAYCSSVSENPSAASTLGMYVGEGVFYLQIMGNTQEGRSSTSPLVNKATVPDALFSNGPITCSLGYPFLRYEGPANKIKNPAHWGERYGELKLSQKMLGNGYWFVDNQDALNANWEKIRAQSPDIVLIYLLDAAQNGGKEGKGLSTDMAKAVIKKAHKSGLRVFAHVETADDLRLAVKLGADVLANLPGNNWDGNGDTKKYELSDADLKMLAKKKTPLIPLLSQAQSAASAKPGIKAFHAKTLSRLFDAGVTVAIGSDDMQRTLRSELNYWFSFENFDHARALKSMCEYTPKVIFPKRKVGKIEEGFEASFLVLSDDPTTNVLKTRVADFKVKNGSLIK